MSEVAAFLLRYGYAVLFVSVSSEQLGVPVPAAPVLLAMGALTGAGHFSLPVAFVVAVSACLVADAVWYQLGRRHGASILNLLCRISLEPDSCVRRTENVFARHGARALLFAKFVPGLNTVASPVAGLTRMRRSRYLAWDMAGAALWAGAYLGIGRAVSGELEHAAEAAFGLGTRLVVVLAAALAVYLLWKYAQRQRFIRRLSIARITPEELRQRIDSGEEVTVVDLRGSLEFEDDGAGVPGAIHLDPEDLDSRLAEIPRDREIVLYCT
jgi:membrane protein DedA with SNARE-associated domain